MKTLLAVASAAIALATSAFAEDAPLSGAWRLSANVESIPIDMLCHIQQAGDRLQGTCVETLTRAPMTRAGRSHALTGRVTGDRVTFSHGGRFLLSSFDVNYAGVLDGNRMTGRIDVFGHTGDFTAVRDAG